MYTDEETKRLEELRSIYEPMANAINFWKAQQWKMVYYGLLLLAAIVGIFKLFEYSFPPLVKYILPFLTIPATILPTYYIWRNQQLLRRDRERLEKIKKSFTKEVQKLLRTPKIYTTHKYDRGYYIPFVAILWIGWFFVFVYLIRKAEMFKTSCAAEYIVILAFTWFGFVTLLGSYFASREA